MAHVVGSALRDQLRGGAVFGLDHNGAAEVHRALADGLLDHAEHIVPQFPTCVSGLRSKYRWGGGIIPSLRRVEACRILRAKIV